MTADPYVYEGTDVLVNNFGLRDEEALANVERTLSSMQMWRLLQSEQPAVFDFALLKDLHRTLFEDIYAFAGEIRTVEMRKLERALSGRSVGYASPSDIPKKAERAIADMEEAAEGKVSWQGLALAVADLWKAHPFREGNTRSVLLFLQQFSRSRGFRLDAEAMSEKPGDTRDALALAATGAPDRLAGILAGAARKNAFREHPVLGRLTFEAAEIVSRMGKAPARLASPGEIVRGALACVSYTTAVVATAKGIVGVPADALPRWLSSGDRVHLNLFGPEWHDSFDERQTNASQPSMVAA